MPDVFELKTLLESSGAHYEIRSYSAAGAIMFVVSFPGERWKIEIHPDGNLELEVFRSGGEVASLDSLDELAARIRAAGFWEEDIR